MNRSENLTHMANQIAKNFAIKGEEVAATATANHINAYWDPRMKQMIIKQAGDDGTNLSKIALAATKLLMEKSDVG